MWISHFTKARNVELPNRDQGFFKFDKILMSSSLSIDDIVLLAAS